MYSCGKIVVKKCQESSYSDTSSMAGKQTHNSNDVLRLLDPGHAFTNDCQNVQNDEQQHHLKIPTFFLALGL